MKQVIPIFKKLSELKPNWFIWWSTLALTIPSKENGYSFDSAGSSQIFFIPMSWARPFPVNIGSWNTTYTAKSMMLMHKRYTPINLTIPHCIWDSFLGSFFFAFFKFSLNTLSWISISLIFWSLIYFFLFFFSYSLPDMVFSPSFSSYASA